MNKILDIISYLEKCGGSDTHTFYDENGQPDVIKARDFAEGLRFQSSKLEDQLVTIEQSGSRVIIKLILVPSVD